MERLPAFKYELLPNGEHVRNMRRYAPARHLVYPRHSASARFASSYAAAGDPEPTFDSRESGGSSYAASDM
jgi:hypothetical protein